MAERRDEGRITQERAPRLLPRNLLTVALATILGFMVVGMLRLTSRVTALELRLESLSAQGSTARLGDGAGASPAGSRPPPGDKPGPSPSDESPGAASQAVGPRGGLRGEDGERLPPGERGAGPGRRPEIADPAATRALVLERLEDYLFVAQFEEETAQAIKDELERSYQVHLALHAKLADGEVTDQELRGSLRTDVLRVLATLTEILGEDEAQIFVEEVLAIPARQIERLRSVGRAEQPVEPE